MLIEEIMNLQCLDYLHHKIMDLNFKMKFKRSLDKVFKIDYYQQYKISLHL